MNNAAGLNSARLSWMWAWIERTLRVAKAARWTGMTMFTMLMLAACGGGGEGGPSERPDFTITSHPADVHVTAGDTANFSISVTGGPLLQWQRKLADGEWADVDGATSTEFVVSPTRETDSGTQFRVRVISAVDSANVATSSIATLTVDTRTHAPVILVHPRAQTVTVGEDVTLSVTATGSSLIYQWQRQRAGSDWSDVEDGTTASLALHDVALESDGEQYRVVVSNELGSVTSGAALLGVHVPWVAPQFTTSPMAVSVVVGSRATFNAVAVGTPAPTMTWQSSVNWGPWVTIPGATGGTYTTPVTTLADDSLRIRALATNEMGDVNSAAVELEVTAAPVALTIHTHPADIVVGSGGSATFSVTATGQPTPTYQWQVSSDGGASFVNLNGATSSSYVLNPADEVDSGKRYRVNVSDSRGSEVSQSAQLTVLQAPEITVQPTESWWRPGQTDGHFVAAAAGENLQYQWQASADGGVTFADISGATTPVYVHGAHAATNINAVRVTVRNGRAMAVSRVAALKQHDWVSVGERATADTLRGVSWVDSETAVAVGDSGTILRSTDSGANWRVVNEGAWSFERLSSVAIQGHLGIAVGPHGLRRTTDGGTHWVLVDVLADPWEYQAVAWSGSSATIVGHGEIKRSIDGGASWADVVSDIGYSTWNSVAFNSRGVGLVVGSGGTVMRSVNGGGNWMFVRDGFDVDEDLTGVTFVDDDTAIAVGTGERVLRSTDAGLTWQSVSIEDSWDFASVAFSSPLVGVVATYYSMYHTTDGGLSWTREPGTEYVDRYAVAFSPSGVGLTVGAHGVILRSTDHGSSWADMVPLDDHYRPSAIAFGSDAVGVTVGSQGKVFRTSDGGSSWQATYQAATYSLDSVAFADADTVVAVGWNGTIIRSIDGGATWAQIVSPTSAMLTSVAFATSLTGTIVGNDPSSDTDAIILHTIDGGATWHSAGVSLAAVSSVAYGSSTVGVAAGREGEILRTTDGGATWNRVSVPGLTGHLVAFASPTTVIVAGGERFFRSTDGGATWTADESGTLFPEATGVRFASATEGIAVGRARQISRSHDGGASWIVDEAGGSVTLVDVAYTPSGVPFAATDGPSIYRGPATPH